MAVARIGVMDGKFVCGKFCGKGPINDFHYQAARPLEALARTNIVDRTLLCSRVCDNAGPEDFQKKYRSSSGKN